LVVDVDELCLDVWVIFWKLAELTEVQGCFLMLADLDEPSRRLDGEEAQDADDGGEVDVHQVRHDPLELRR